MSKATTLISDCNDTPWIQVTFVIALSTPAIIGIYEATKNHLIYQVPAYIIDKNSGASIGQVAKNPSEMSKSGWGAHVSYMSNNDLLGDMPYWSTISFEK